MTRAWAAGAIALGVVVSVPAIARAQETPARDQRTAVTAKNAPAVVRHLRRRIVLEPDGRLTQTVTARVTIREVSAIQLWGQLQFAYFAEHESVELNELVVEKADGRRIDADPAALRDAPTPQSGSFDAPVFHDTRAKEITVPTVAVGDTVAYSVTTRRHTPFLANHFWTDHTFETTAVVEREEFEIDWPETMPLALKVRPSSAGMEVPVSSGSGRRARRWTHEQLTVEEPDAATLRDVIRRTMKGRADPPDIQVSTFSHWDQVASWFGALTAEAETPSETLRARARQIASTSESAAEQMSALHKAVAQDVRYVSLAFGEGRYRPRPASLSLSTMYGDCKDKHALLAALGRELGLEVRPVLISTARALEDDFPSPGQFDHVISLVKDGAGHETWVDATAAVARPGALFAPIRDKQGVLVETTGRARLVRTPGTPPRFNAMRVRLTGSFAVDGRYLVAVRRTLAGDIEMLMRTAFRNSDEQARMRIAEQIAHTDNLGDNLKVRGVRTGETYDLSTPFWVEYDAEGTYSSPMRDKDWTHWVPSPSMVPPALDDQQTVVELGDPTEEEADLRFTLPSGLAVTPPVPVRIDNPIASYSSRYEVVGDELRVARRLQTKVARVEADGLDAYRALRRAIDADWRQTFAVAAAPPEAVAAAAANADPARAGADAITAGNYVRAVELLRKATSTDPSHRTAWNNLGRAFHAQGKWSEAIEAYDRQIAINAFDEYAYNNRALSELALQRFDAAETSFRKQIEVSPLDKYAHRNLGRLLLQRKRSKEAHDALQTAVRVSPDDRDAHMLLARTLASLGRSTEAAAVFEKVVSLSPGPSTWNNVAWWMVESGVELEKALEYARSAVARASASLATLSLADRTKDHEAIARTRSLAAYWDTLGWIQFKRGQIDEALRYVRASWQVVQSAVVGEHLGAVYERLGREREARAAYRMALSFPDASEMLRDRAGLLEESGRSGPASSDSQSLALSVRTLKVKRLGAPGAGADVMLLVDRTGTITAARLADPQSAGGDFTSRLVGERLPLDPPDASPFTLAARAVARCTPSPDDCSLILYSPVDAFRRAQSGTAAR